MDHIFDGRWARRHLAFGVSGIVGLGALLLVSGEAIRPPGRDPTDPPTDRWANDRFAAQPAQDVSQDVKRQVTGQAKVELARLTEPEAPRGPGACKTGDRLEFLGGWTAGAGGVTVFSDPVGEFDALLAAPPDEQSDFVRQDPIHYDWRGGCGGVGSADKMEAFLSEPLGGGPVHGGKFLLVSVNAGFVGVPSRACLIVVQSKDVTCAKDQ